MIQTDGNWQTINTQLARQPLWILVIDGVGYFWGNFNMAQLQPAVGGYGFSYGSSYGND